MLQIRYFTRTTWFTIIILSVGLYYAFMWVCNYLQLSDTYESIGEMHQSPQYYLTIGLCVILCFAFDLFGTAFMFNVMPSPPDVLREIASAGRPFEEVKARFDAIYRRIE